MRLSALALVLLAGCASGPDYAAPDLAALTPAAFEDAGKGDASAPDVAAWWMQFGDGELSSLVADALSANRDLRAAAANVEAARAALGERRFDLAPTVTASGDYRRQRASAAGLGASIPVVSADDPFPGADYHDAALDARWELDFWGRVRRSVEAGHADYRAAEADRRNALVIVSAETANAYFALRGAQQRLAIARRNAALQEDTLSLTRSLADAGRASEFDTARAQAQLETTRSAIPMLDADARAQMRRLAVLTGRAPGALDDRLAVPRAAIASAPPAPAGDPALVIRQRPDIRAAEQRLAAATARIGVATADLFPEVTFVGAVGASAASLAGFGGDASLDYGFGPSIRWAALDLGRVRARIRQADAAAVASLAAYEQTVLSALEETANAFTARAREEERAARLDAAAQSAATAASLARSRYEAGVDGFIAVLDAERSLLAAEDALAASRTASMQRLVGVYRVIGGAWRVEKQGASPTVAGNF